MDSKNVFNIYFILLPYISVITRSPSLARVVTWKQSCFKAIFLHTQQQRNINTFAVNLLTQ